VAEPSPTAPRRPLARPLPLVGKPWFWLLFVGTLFTVPFFKSMNATLPEPLPGMDGAALDFTLPGEDGVEVSLADLAGHLLVITELPLASGTQTEATFAGIRRLRKRLRGLGSTVVFVVLCHGGSPAMLTQLLDEKVARKPVNVFLIDEDGARRSWLRREAGSQSADFFLLDRHARLRGLYENTEADIDTLVMHAGQLANWLDSDPELAPAG